MYKMPQEYTKLNIAFQKFPRIIRPDRVSDGKAPIVENVVAPLCASVDMCDMIRLIDVDITT